MLQLDSLPLEPEHADTVPRRVAPAAPRRAPPLAGEAPSMQRIRRLIDQVAAHDTTVLITGESGTGKEVIAQQIHACSARADKPFVAVNCGAIPAELLESELFGHEKGAFTGAITTRKGRFELAEGGTLFLDEIGDMPMPMQVKLLRVLQERSFERVGGTRTMPCDVRIVAATHRDLDAAVNDGLFREDLYYRLNVFPIHLPPLRDRRGDIPSLVTHFLERYNGELAGEVTGFSEAALAAMTTHPWPGNIRELENLIERLVALTDKTTLTEEDLPFEYHLARLDDRPESKAELLQAACDTCERNFILRALERKEWNVSAAARYLGVPLSTLKHKMGRLEAREHAKRFRRA